MIKDAAAILEMVCPDCLRIDNIVRALWREGRYQKGDNYLCSYCGRNYWIEKPAAPRARRKM